MTFEQRMAELGVDLSDLPESYESMVEVVNAANAARKWFNNEEPRNKITLEEIALAHYILHLTDIIDRMETRIVNLTGERDYLLTLYGFDCEECKRYDECNRDGDYCERELVEDWAGVPEDWRPDDDGTGDREGD